MNLLRDFKYTLRVMGKTPGFTALTVAVMTVGLAVSIFIASIISTSLIKPINHPDGERLMRLGLTIDGEKEYGYSSQLLLHHYQAIKEQTNTLELLVALQTSTASMTDGVQSVRYQGIYATPELFEFGNVKPILGRNFSAADDRAGALPVVVISEKLWRNFFGGDPDIIGSTVVINYETTEIVGVLPESFQLPYNNQLWLPLKKDAGQISLEDSPAVTVYGKLKPGVSIEMADRDLKAIMARNEQFQSSDEQVSVHLDTFKHFSLGPNTIRIFKLMMFAGLFVLVLCCINVGNLILAQANLRAKETAIRAALGAPRTRLIMQMMWQSIIICAVSGALAAIVANYALDAATAFFDSRWGDGFPFWMRMELSASDLVFAAGVVIVSALITGFVPAWKASGANFNAVLKDAAKTSLGKSAATISRVIVGVEIALSCALMIIAGVLFLLIHEAVSKGYGVPIDNFLIARVNPLKQSYPEKEDQIRYFDRVFTDINDIPGVVEATVISHVPTEYGFGLQYQAEGQEFPTKDYPVAFDLRVYPNSFDVLSMPVLQGRGFLSTDTADSLPVAVISENLAQRSWPGESPLGKRIRTISDKGSTGRWLTVVGVVPQVAQGVPYGSRRDMPSLYRPFEQKPRDAMAVLLKSHGDPYRLLDPLSEVLTRIDPNVPPYRSYSLTDQALRNRGYFDFIKGTFLVFALGALVMAATGIYGVMSNHIEQRTQQFGIRRALGASDGRIVMLLLKQSSIQLILGILVGVPLGYFMSLHFVETIGSDSGTYRLAFVAVPAIITAVVALATLVPAWRVVHLQPGAALRYE